jgi:hypothetical protein
MFHITGMSKPFNAQDEGSISKHVARKHKDRINRCAIKCAKAYRNQ